MTPTLNKVPRAAIAIYRNGALPLILRNRNRDTKLLEAFAPTLSFKATLRGVDLFTLTVGAGITLTADEGVADARATIMFTAAQSALLPVGSFAAYELTEGPPGARVPVMVGTLEGEDAR